MKIRELIEQLETWHAPLELYEDSGRDRVLYGNADQVCTGYVTCIWADLNVIQNAISLGANLIICHEALFWNHGDETQWLKDNPVFQIKSQLIDEHQICVYRDHDHIHAGIPVNGSFKDGIFLGLSERLGWSAYQKNTHMPVAYEIPEMSLTDIADLFKRSLHLKQIRTAGDPDTRIKRIIVCMHLFGQAGDRDWIRRNDYDLLVAGETVDYSVVEYLQDVSFTSQKMAMIMPGHFKLEEPGMEYLHARMKELFPDLPSMFCETRHLYGYL